MNEQTIAKILTHLSKHQAQDAWEEFLRLYAGTVLGVVRHFERDEDAIADCFVHVCQQLIKNRFQRLRKFNVRGPARFTTWLRAVVRNLCLDWHRQEFGRYRPFNALRRASALDQQIYAKVYEEGLSAPEVLESLRPAFPSLNSEAVAAAIQRIAAVLTPRQRWLLTVRRAQVLPLDGEWILGELDVVDPQPGPEAAAIAKDQTEKLGHAVVQLPAGDRVLLGLRFGQSLTLEQIARVEGLENAQGADRRIREIVARLRLILDSGAAEK